MTATKKTVTQFKLKYLSLVSLNDTTTILIKTFIITLINAHYIYVIYLLL